MSSFAKFLQFSSVCGGVNKRSVFYGYRAAMGEGNMGYGKWIRIPPNMDPEQGDDQFNLSLKRAKKLYDLDPIKYGLFAEACSPVCDCAQEVLYDLTLTSLTGKHLGR